MGKRNPAQLKRGDAEDADDGDWPPMRGADNQDYDGCCDESEAGHREQDEADTPCAR
jgi:hypothetical protein